MANINSYYLYQKYEKRGDQPWIPLDVYSVDGDGTMPLVVKEHGSDSCPVIPDGTDDYAYTEWRSADGYMCDDGTKYARERRYVSNDNVNWTATDIYRITDTVIQYNSTDCGYSEDVEEYDCDKWEVVANDYICNEGNKCQKLRKYVRVCNDCDNCNSSWVATDIYQIGETVIEYNSNDCGYTASTEEYRWVNVGYVCVGNDKCYRQQKQVSYTYGDTWENLSEYRTGDVYQKDSADCTITPVIYRWVNLNPSQDYYCDGTIKYYKQQCQKSYDSGNTWVNETPPQYRKGSIADASSVDCGATPPTGETLIRWVQMADTVCVEDYKLKIINNKTLSETIIPCNGSSALTNNEVWGNTDASDTSTTHSYTFYVGSCVKKIDESCFAYSNYVSNIDIFVYVPNTITKIEAASFSNHYLQKTYFRLLDLQNVEQPTYFNRDGYIFAGNDALKSVGGVGSGADVEIPSHWDTIPEGMFFACRGIESIEIPSYIKNIGTGGRFDIEHFANCINVKNLVINEGVELISDDAFQWCGMPSVVRIPDSVREIKSHAFDAHSDYTNGHRTNFAREIIVGSGCTSIGYCAFSQCEIISAGFPSWTITIVNDYLERLTIYATTPPDLPYGGIFLSDFYPSSVSLSDLKVKIYVPSGSLNAYKTAWNNYASIIYPI